MSYLKYSPSLDGVRGISIILVLLSHWLNGFGIGGFLGVSIFFFISGFLITRLLITEHESNKRISFSNFYTRRALRLYPALLLMIAVTAIVATIISCQLNQQEVLASLFYYFNYYLVHFRQNENACSYMFNPLWSLSMEEHFYLLYPILFAWLFKKRKTFVVVLCCLLALALAIRLATCFFTVDFPTAFKSIYTSTHTRFDAILFGCITAVLLQNNKNDHWLQIASKPIAILLALAVLLGSFKIMGKYFYGGLHFTVQGICLMILHAPICSGISIAKKFINNRALVMIGKMSYSLYLFMNIGTTLAGHFFGSKSINAPWLTTAIGTCIVLAYISYFLLERNMLKLRKKFGSSAT